MKLFSSTSRHLVTVRDRDADVLHTRAARVRDAQSDETRAIVADMIRIMRAERGIGLAAPQIGVSRRIITFDMGADGVREHGPLVCINPVIVRAARTLVMTEEGCLSIPGTFIPIVRAAQVTVRYEDTDGNTQTVTVRDLPAVAFQHEIDHLDGVLMTQRYAQQSALRAQFEESSDDNTISHRIS